MSNVYKWSRRSHEVFGFRVDDDGVVHDFAGQIRRKHATLAGYSTAARRKYHDESITITEANEFHEHYKCELKELLSISERID